jgi:peroxiredoxin
MKFFFAFLLAAFSLSAAGELSGRRAPGFALPDLQLNFHDGQDYRGKIMIIEFMQTTCPHCETFSGILKKVLAKYGDKVAALAITNPPDNQTTVGQFVSRHGNRVPVLFDCGQVAAAFLKATPKNPTINLPHVFLVDAQGMIRNDFGYNLLTKDIFEGDGLFRELDKLLAAKPK